MKKIYFLFFTLLFTAATSYGQVVINEIDVDTPGADEAEFVELKAAPNASLDGYIVVFFNGSNDLSYGTWDLTGKTADANGFFILANTALISGNDIDLPPGGSGYIQNGPDAIAIYQDSAANFPEGTAVTMTNLIDAIVYGTSDSDDPELLSGLGETVQYDEDLNGAKDTESLQLNAAGTAYETKAPTFRNSNDAAVCELSLTSTSAVCDAFTVGTDTYTATVDFSGGGTSTYTVTADSGTVDLSAGDPSTDATGTITVTGVAEGTDVIISAVDGALCDLSSTVTSPSCEPSNSLPLYEGFDYTVGTDIGTEANWNNYSGSDNPIDVVSGSLSYPGLAGSTGNSVYIEGGFIDSELVFTPVTTGEVFASFIINVSDLSNITDLADGGYFVLLGDFDARLWVHPDTDPVGTTYDIALTNGSSGENFTTTKYNVGDSVFIVISYNVATGAINGWVNPAGDDFGGSAPTALLTDTDASPSPFVDTFALRQDSAGETPAMTFDELRIGTTWADVTPTTLSITNENRNNFSVYPNPVSSGIVNISSTNSEAINVQVFDILGKQVKNQTLTNNTLNVSSLKSGVYIIKITQNNASTTKKLVIK
ncbi:T9SS type A sorting domain-containing protein [Winogradskyella forsetii]|uniref:T9SS type A sorting domain-containing protein n=1 Tax=Winogradskyella forsetii TaxID=2686077 RepID=UPI0015C0F5DE|nr:T9SS type A sorting domain-containing protein [Winogradskyella forsetii]